MLNAMWPTVSTPGPTRWPRASPRTCSRNVCTAWVWSWSWFPERTRRSQLPSRNAWRRPEARSWAGWRSPRTSWTPPTPPPSTNWRPRFRRTRKSCPALRTRMRARNWLVLWQETRTQVEAMTPNPPWTLSPRGGSCPFPGIPQDPLTRCSCWRPRSMSPPNPKGPPRPRSWPWTSWPVLCTTRSDRPFLPGTLHRRPRKAH